MVKGLPKFREHFAGYEEHYVLIGGAACDVLMEEAGLEFRATKDLDIVLCVEVLNEEFAKVFWEFIEAGGYEQREKSTGGKEFYRFLKPAKQDYPAQLELFSRKLGSLPLAEGSHLTPVPIDGLIDSLSAILLDDDYYQCMQQGATVIDDVRVLMPEYVLVFKAKAYLDLNARLEAGEEISGKEIRKHRLDVFRLFQLLSPELRVQIPESIKGDVGSFIEAMQQEQIDISSLGYKGRTQDEILQNIQTIYELG